MPATIPIGPYRTLRLPEGGEFPYYIIPFDKHGYCEGPKTEEHLHDHSAGYSDIFLFSHGWNNDWTAATNRYESFITGVQSLRHQHGLPVPPAYKPLLVGVFWPSQALSWFESETGPGFAAADPGAQDQAANELSQTLRDISSDLTPDKRARFYRLFQSEKLESKESIELAEPLADITSADTEKGTTKKPQAVDLLAAAVSINEPEPDFEAIGVAAGSPQTPQAAFSFGDVAGALDPRNIVKPFTVWQMKDRAGKIGARGVAALLQGLLNRSGARIHLIGHSFGCKVVMTALSRIDDSSRLAESALLLQPAVSQYAFAATVPERGVPGGFFKALKRVRLPILSTFSAHDQALTKMFHLAVRRHDDLGELQMAATGTPSRFGALGGFGQ